MWWFSSRWGRVLTSSGDACLPSSFTCLIPRLGCDLALFQWFYSPLNPSWDACLQYSLAYLGPRLGSQFTLSLLLLGQVDLLRIQDLS